MSDHVAAEAMLERVRVKAMTFQVVCVFVSAVLVGLSVWRASDSMLWATAAFTFCLFLLGLANYAIAALTRAVQASGRDGQ